MFDLISEIMQTLRNNKLRTALTGLAVAWGIFMLIVLLGMSRGVVNAFNAGMQSQGSNTMNVYPGVTTQAWHGYKQGREIQLKHGDMEQIGRQNSRQVDNVSATIWGPSLTISTPHDYMTASYNGVYPSEARMRSLVMARGRFINDRDMNEKRKVAVLSEQVAEALFGNAGKAIGSQVRMGDLSFEIIGVYESKWNRTVFVPFTTARMLAGNSDDIGSIVVELQNVSTMAEGLEAENQTRRTLAALHDFKADDEGALSVWNKFTNQLTMQTGMEILNMTVWIIGIFTLLSGIIGVSNIMFVSVRERTHEIGIRRAIGARPHSILAQIIMESIAITTLFGYIGIVAGTVATELMSRYLSGDYFLNPTVDLWIALDVTVVLIIAGCCAGLFPALKALKVKPVEALRDE